MISPSGNSGVEGALIPSRLPKVPSSGDNYLRSNNGGRPSWNSLPDFSEILSKISSLESLVDTLNERINSTVSRLDSASIDAQCQDGTVTVTLNL